MQLEQPIAVDLRSFILEGRFDCVRPGQDKAWILHNFPDPDGRSHFSGNRTIWQYGNLELHFYGEMLVLIWCDNFHRLNGGPGIRLEKWLLARPARATLGRVLRALVEERADFALRHNPKLETVQIRVARSQVDLHFDLNHGADYRGATERDFLLSGFGLCDESHRMAWK